MFAVTLPTAHRIAATPLAISEACLGSKLISPANFLTAAIYPLIGPAISSKEFTPSFNPSEIVPVMKEKIPAFFGIESIPSLAVIILEVTLLTAQSIAATPLAISAAFLGSTVLPTLSAKSFMAAT